MKQTVLVVSLLLVAVTARAETLHVYVLAGQSNMQGHAQIRTFPHIGMDPATAPMLAEMQNPDGSPRVCDRVWISSIGSADQEQTGKLTAGFGASPQKIGPEFTFGLYLQQRVKGPILLIKTAWGGKSLHTDFRPPGAGPYVFTQAQLANLQKQGKNLDAVKAEKVKETGVYYRLMIDHVKQVLSDPKRVVPTYDPAAGYQLDGVVWFQGWNDLVDSGVYPERDQPGGYDAYSTALTHFIRDVRKDLAAPSLPFVIGVLGVGGPVADFPPDEKRYQASHRNFREAMAAPAKLPEFAGTVAAVWTEKYWDHELSDARAKEDALRQEAKRPVEGNKPSAAAEKAAFERLRAERLTDHERTILDVGISNFAFHYLGSAKILGGIGKAFAEAMADLQHLPRNTP
jgi:alpha-galactosidase